MSHAVTPEHMDRATRFLESLPRDGGLAPLDIERFWQDQETALADPFGSHIPQVPLAAFPTRECLFAELDIPEDWHRLHHDAEWRARLSKAYNDRAEPVIGRRPLNESVPEASHQWPTLKGLHDVFEARNEWSGDSYWLHQSANTESELEALLDRVDQLDIREFILPPNWEAEKSRLGSLGVPPPLYRQQRGPVTFATSVFGSENLIFLIIDNPDLAARFRDTILRVMLDIARVLDEEAGHTPESAPRGFRFADDNCALLTPEMYEFFGAPILGSLFARYAPAPTDLRYQHSDSDMGHLLPSLARLGINRCNFGPRVTVAEIRRHLPDCVIDGQLAPFTLMRNDETLLVAEFLRDLDMARHARGLRFTTAGSIINGSKLSSFRLLMAVIQSLGQYPPAG